MMSLTRLRLGAAPIGLWAGTARPLLGPQVPAFKLNAARDRTSIFPRNDMEIKNLWVPVAWACLS